MDRAADVRKWQELVARVRPRPGMYGLSGFSDVCALLVGFDLGREDDDTLHGFYEWLCLRRPDHANLAFPSQVAMEVTGSASVLMAEEQDRACVERLFDLLSEFLLDEELEPRLAEAREQLGVAADLLPTDARVEFARSVLTRGPVVDAFRWLVETAAQASPEQRQAALPALRAAHVLLRQDQHPRWRHRMLQLEDDVRAGIQWRSQPEICVFVATREAPPAAVDFSGLDPPPETSPAYPLEDAEGLLPGWSVTELDLRFAEIPEPLARYLRDVLRTARDTTGGVVWLGFEGSFHFEHVLTPDVATSVYGVCAPGMPPQVAITRLELESEQWAAAVAAVRERVG